MMMKKMKYKKSNQFSTFQKGRERGQSSRRMRMRMGKQAKKQPERTVTLKGAQHNGTLF